MHNVWANEIFFFAKNYQKIRFEKKDCLTFLCKATTCQQKMKWISTYLKVRLVIGVTLINYNISVLYIFWTENKNSIIGTTNLLLFCRLRYFQSISNICRSTEGAGGWAVLTPEYKQINPMHCYAENDNSCYVRKLNMWEYIVNIHEGFFRQPSLNAIFSFF